MAEKQPKRWPQGLTIAARGQAQNAKKKVDSLFSRPPKGEINANTTGGTRKRKGRLDTATTPPAEASGVSGAMPTVRKEEGVVLVRDRVRLVRSGRGVAG